MNKKIFKNNIATLLYILYIIMLISDILGIFAFYFITGFDVTKLPIIVGGFLLLGCFQYLVAMRIFPLKITTQGDFIVFSFFLSKKIVSRKQMKESKKILKLILPTAKNAKLIKCGTFSFVIISKAAFDEYEELCQLLLR